MAEKIGSRQLLFLEPGIIEGETREEAVERLIKVMESRGFTITDKTQKTRDDAER
jgi:acetolactate synthase regulatory subunit